MYTAKYMGIAVRLTEQELQEVIQYITDGEDFRCYATRSAYELRAKFRIALNDLLKKKQKAIAEADEVLGSSE